MVSFDTGIGNRNLQNWKHGREGKGQDRGEVGKREKRWTGILLIFSQDLNVKEEAAAFGSSFPKNKSHITTK